MVKRQTISDEIWSQNYQGPDDNSIEDTWKRQARACASVEKDQQRFYEDFLWLLTDFKGVAGGRITANLGIEGRDATTLYNCFLPETKIFTKRGNVSIQDVNIGDYVLTHNGNWKRVSNLLSRWYDGDINVYKSSYLIEDLYATTEHPFYNGDGVWVKSKENDTITFPYINQTDTEIEIDISLYVDASGHLSRPSDKFKHDDDKVWYLRETSGGNGCKVARSSVPVNRKITVDEGFAYVIGRFIGDGCVFSYNINDKTNNGMNIVFSDSEKESLFSCKKILDNKFGIDFNVNLGKTFHYLRKTNVVIGKFLSESCGVGFKNKKVPSFIFESPLSVIKSFLVGVLDADGCVTKNGLIKLSLANESLIDDLKTLFNLIGVYPRKRPAHVKHIKNASPAYLLVINATNGSEIIKSLSKVYNDRRTSKSFKKKKLSIFTTQQNDVCTKDFVKDTLQYSGYVYNLSVEDDESYVANGVVVHNCYVHNPKDINYTDPDSINGIYDMLKAQAHTLKSEGGYGMNFSWIRPSGFYVYGIDSRTPGVLKFMELWDKSSEIITMGSEDVIGARKKNEKKKIRKGAQMGVLDCWHPDIEAFIDAKQVQGRLSKFNISVGITEGFMEAVKADADWNLEYPDVEFEKFSKEWNGDIHDWKDKGYPVVICKTIKARDLWKKITKATYQRNDPGVLFLDIANKRNPLHYAERIVTTNPCFHGSERFLTETGYVTFEDSSVKGWCGVFTDGRISYDSDGQEKPENWKIDVSGNGTVFRDSSPAFVTKEYSDLIELEFSNGQIVKCTPDHHFATSEGMIEARDLSPEHDVLVAKVDPPKVSITGKTPQTHNEIEAFLMGLIAGDGTFSNNKDMVHIDLWGDDKDRMSDICSSMIDKLKLDFPNLVKSKGTKPLSAYYISKTEDKVRISSIWLARYLDKCHGFNRETKNIVPEKILNFARNTVGQFYLAGLYYADGTISKNTKKGISVRLPQNDKEYLRQVQLICHAQGITTKIYFRREGGIREIRGKEFNGSDDYELITTHGGWKNFDRIGFGGHPDKEPHLLELLSLVKENYNKKSYTNLVGVKEIEGDTVYCLKEDVSRSLIVNTVSARRCGEIGMATGVCLLMSLNLVKFIKKTNSGWDFDFKTFDRAVRIATRFADNINDISRTPLQEYSDAVTKKRRIGLGVLSLGSLHYILGIKFGSEESLKLIEKIFKTKAEAEILTSAELGKEKGSFELFDKEKYFSSHWWKTLPISKDVKKQVEKLGAMRNSHRSANAPTGNMSIYVGVVSGGIEPVFMKEYARWSIVPEIERKALRKGGFEFPDIGAGEWFETKSMKMSKVGTDDVLFGEFDGVEYQVDKNRGLTKKSLVEDYGWSFVKEHLSEEEIKDRVDNGVFVTTEDLSVQDHINTLKVISPYVDMNSSKTVNVPNDFDYENFQSVYMDAWEAGIKGITTYRAGTMTAVLESVDSKTEEKRGAPKRPKSLMCAIHKAKINGKEWAVIVGFLDASYSKPYEVFAGPAENFNAPNKSVGILTKKKRGVYDLELSKNGEVIEDILSIFDDDDSAWATRLVSMSLRHGIPLEFLCEQLSKDGFVTDVNKVLARILKKYIEFDIDKMNCPKCDSKNIQLSEGCLTCMDCGYGKCG